MTFQEYLTLIGEHPDNQWNTCLSGNTRTTCRVISTGSINDRPTMFIAYLFTQEPAESIMRNSMEINFQIVTPEGKFQPTFRAIERIGSAECNRMIAKVSSLMDFENNLEEINTGRFTVKGSLAEMELLDHFAKFGSGDDIDYLPFR